VKIERFLGVQELVQIRFLGQIADPLILADLGGRRSEDDSLAIRGKQKAEQQFDRGGLTRAVGAQETKYLAAVDLQVQSGERAFLLPAPEIPVNLGQSARFDNYFLGHERPPRQSISGRTVSGRNGRAVILRDPEHVA